MVFNKELSNDFYDLDSNKIYESLPLGEKIFLKECYKYHLYFNKNLISIKQYAPFVIELAQRKHCLFHLPKEEMIAIQKKIGINELEIKKEKHVHD